jgi:peroxiredoxin
MRLKLSHVADVAVIAFACFAGFSFYQSRTGVDKPAKAPSLELPKDSVVLPFRLTTATSELKFPGKSDSTTLLLVFRSDCPACAKQKHDWSALGSKARQSGVRVLGTTAEDISGADIQGYFEAGTAVLARTLETGDLSRRLFVAVVPTTIILDGSGKIRFHHSGVMDSSALRMAYSSVK